MADYCGGPTCCPTKYGYNDASEARNDTDGPRTNDLVELTRDLITEYGTEIPAGTLGIVKADGRMIRGIEFLDIENPHYADDLISSTTGIPIHIDDLKMVQRHPDNAFLDRHLY